jgi:hypothetical protein
MCSSVNFDGFKAGPPFTARLSDPGRSTSERAGILGQLASRSPASGASIIFCYGRAHRPIAREENR